jgi:hypothetical protein
MLLSDGMTAHVLSILIIVPHIPMAMCQHYSCFFIFLDTNIFNIYFEILNIYLYNLFK